MCKWVSWNWTIIYSKALWRDLNSLVGIEVVLVKLKVWIQLSRLHGLVTLPRFSHICGLLVTRYSHLQKQLKWSTIALHHRLLLKSAVFKITCVLSVPKRSKRLSKLYLLTELLSYFWQFYVVGFETNLTHLSCSSKVKVRAKTMPAKSSYGPVYLHCMMSIADVTTFDFMAMDM